MARVSIFLIAVVLISGTVGCIGPPPAQYNLNISSTEGGSVTTPGEGSFTYEEGDVVELVAEADEGDRFVNWTGNVSTIADASAAKTTIAMSDGYIITANFAVGLRFDVDALLALSGPAALPPEERSPCVTLAVWTDIVVDSVRVDLPDGRSVIIPRYTDVFSSDVDWMTSFRFVTCEPGMAIAGGEYVFTGLDVTGEPIPGAKNSDIWVGGEPPAPPSNVRAEVTKDGILVSWDDGPIIPASFEPAADPQVGWYGLEIDRIETLESVYGAAYISASSYVIPKDRADFVEWKDYGLSLSEMEDGTYLIVFGAHSVAPTGSLGKEGEYGALDMGQAVVFTIEGGEITIG